MLGFVGCGNMAQAMLKGILAKGLYKADEIIVSRRTKEALDALHEELGVQTTTDNKEVAEKADVLVLAIKPYQFADVIPEIAPVCKENALVISIAAGQTIANIEKLFGKTMKIVRTMPNTPALVLAGATGMCFHPSVSKEERETAITIFESFGVVAEVSENMEKYELGIAVAKLNDFIWEEFCDWYIEMVKPRLYNDEDTTKNAAIWTLKTVLIDALKLLHPYMPFITEEIFCNIQDDEESIMISSWPVYDEKFNFPDEEVAIQTIKEAVRNIRNVRAQMNVAPSRKAKVYVVSEDALIRDIFENGRVFFATLAYASEVAVQSDKSGIPDDAVSAVIPGAVLYIPFAELVDIDKEIERLKKEEGRLNGEIKRCEGMLGNEKFISKAPQAKIDEEKAKLEKYQQMLAQVRERLQALTK